MADRSNKTKLSALKQRFFVERKQSGTTRKSVAFLCIVHLFFKYVLCIENVFVFLFYSFFARKLFFFFCARALFSRRRLRESLGENTSPKDKKRTTLLPFFIFLPFFENSIWKREQRNCQIIRVPFLFSLCQVLFSDTMVNMQCSFGSSNRLFTSSLCFKEESSNLQIDQLNYTYCS